MIDHVLNFALNENAGKVEIEAEGRTTPYRSVNNFGIFAGGQGKHCELRGGGGWRVEGGMDWS